MILRNGHIECFKVNTNAGVSLPVGAKIEKDFLQNPNGNKTPQPGYELIFFGCFCLG